MTFTCGDIPKWMVVEFLNMGDLGVPPFYETSGFNNPSLRINQ